MRRKFKSRKFSDRMKEQWYRSNVIAICVAFILLFCLSTGYAALMQNLEVQGNVAIRANKDIRINSIVNTFSSCGTDVYNPKYTEDMIIVVGDLPGLECTLQYDITIKNNTEFIMEVMDIEDLAYNNPAILYEFDNLEIGTLIPEGSEQTYSLTFKYDPSLSSLPLETQIGATFKFVFDYADIFVYKNNYVTDGLVLLYDAKNNSGQGNKTNINIWKDLIGTNDGKLLGDPTWGHDYLEFDGVNDKVEFKGDLTNTYTIISSFYNDPLHTAVYQRIWADNPFPSLCLQISGVNRFAWLFGHGEDAAFPNSFPISGVVQVAMTFDGTKIELYVNGNLVSNKALSIIAPSVAKAYLGGRGTDNLRQFKGKMYNFMIYDKVLNTSEIIHNYNAFSDSKTIPIKTTAQLLKIGSGESIMVDGVEYDFVPNAHYILENDLAMSYDGIWTPNVSVVGSVTTYDKVVTITNTQDGSTHYFQNQLYVTDDNAIKDGLILHYDSINNTGSGHSNSTLTWKDLKGNNDGTLLDGPIWNDHSLTFDGINDKVAFRGDITNEYSIIITIKPVFAGQHPRLFAENPFPTAFLHTANSYKIGFFAQGKDQIFTPSGTPMVATPTYVVLTYDSSKVSLYVNGEFVSNITTTTNPTSTALAYLGGRLANDRQYTGKIYDFMIYDRVLSNFEIEKSYIGNSSKYTD